MRCQNFSCMFFWTDGRTDGQTDARTELRSQDRASIAASRGKNKINKITYNQQAATSSLASRETAQRFILFPLPSNFICKIMHKIGLLGHPMGA